MMSKWKNVTLRDVIAFNPRLSLAKGAVAKKVAMENIQPFTRNVASYEVDSYRGGTKFQNGDTIMARITPCLENGKIARVNFLGDGEVAFGSTEYIVLREIKGVTDSSFVYYLATSPALRSVAIKSMVGSSGRQRVQQSVLEQHVISLPTFYEQQAIAATLSCLDDKIEVNNKINANLEVQAQAIFKSWFVDFEPFRDGGFVDSELGPIPEGWRVEALDDVCSLITKGITPKYSDDSDERVINQKCIRDGLIDMTLARKHIPKKINEKWIEQGDVLINSTGTGTLGRVAQVWFHPIKVTVDSHITIVRSRTSNLISYLGANLCGKQHIFESMASGSTGQTDLPRERLKRMSIIIPSKSHVDKFAAIYVSMKKKIATNQSENTTLASIRDTLLPKLMSGEIEVPVAESIIKERI